MGATLGSAKAELYCVVGVQSYAGDKLKSVSADIDTDVKVYKAPSFHGSSSDDRFGRHVGRCLRSLNIKSCLTLRSVCLMSSLGKRDG